MREFLERMREVQCWNCGTELKGREKYCKNCGVQIKVDALWPEEGLEEEKTVRISPWEARQGAWEPEPVPEPQGQQTCRVCGRPIRPGTAVCSYCGAVQGQAPGDKPRRRRRGVLAVGIVAAVVVAAAGCTALLYGLGLDPLAELTELFVPEKEPQETDPTGTPAQDSQSDASPLLEDALEEEPSPVRPSGEEVEEQPSTPAVTPSQPAVEPPVQEEVETPSPVEALDDARMAQLVSAHASKAAWSVAVLDLEDGTCYGSASAAQGQSASAMVMIPVLYTVAAQVDGGALAMDTLIPITQNLGGRTQLSSQVGKSLDVETLLCYMLQYSDNIAANTLLEALGFSTVEEVCHQAGFTSVAVADYLMATQDYTDHDNYVSGTDLCGMLAALYGDSFSAFGRDFLRQYMHLQDDTAALGLLNAAPSGVATLNLNGQKMDKYNEVAIFDDGQRAYVVAFLGHGDTLERLQQAAKEVGSYCIETLEIGA